MAEHTPTPWGLNPDDRPGMAWNVEIVEGDNPDMRIAFMANGRHSEANAAFIVKAVNNHDALVKALQGAMVVLESMPRPTTGLVSNELQAAFDKRVKAVRDALASVGGVDPA